MSKAKTAQFKIEKSAFGEVSSYVVYEKFGTCWLRKASYMMRRDAVEFIRESKNSLKDTLYDYRHSY